MQVGQIYSSRGAHNEEIANVNVCTGYFDRDHSIIVLCRCIAECRRGRSPDPRTSRTAKRAEVGSATAANRYPHKDHAYRPIQVSRNTAYHLPAKWPHSHTGHQQGQARTRFLIDPLISLILTTGSRNGQILFVRLSSTPGRKCPSFTVGTPISGIYM
jgi:hypothetical protein